MISNFMANKRIDWIIDPRVADIDGTWMPSSKDVTRIWDVCSAREREAIVAFISCDTYGEVVQRITSMSLQACVTMLQTNKKVVLAVVAGRLCNLPSDTARYMYLDTLMSTVHQREIHRNEISSIIKTDKDHLIELSQKLRIDGDGKRDILKQLVAYGMQTKLHEEAELDHATGLVSKPAVYTLADPRMALLSVQELNKMDHEYSEDESSTSSTESQAERIRRLRQTAPKEILKTLNDTANREAKKLNGIAKQISKRQISDLEKLEKGDDE